MVCSGNIFGESNGGKKKNVTPNSQCPLCLLHRVAGWASTVLASSELKYILEVQVVREKLIMSTESLGMNEVTNLFYFQCLKIYSFQNLISKNEPSLDIRQH